jgi:hypothetical protein
MTIRRLLKDNKLAGPQEIEAQQRQARVRCRGLSTILSLVLRDAMCCADEAA